MIDVKGIFDWMLAHWSVTAFCITCVIQVTPIIKCNPLTALFKWIGRLTTADVMKEIKTVQSDVLEIKENIDSQQQTIDENERDRIRWEILDFANSCRNGRKHTKDEFEHIITLNGKYESLMQKSGETNGVYTMEYEYLMEIYRKCQRENSFL